MGRQEFWSKQTKWRGEKLETFGHADRERQRASFHQPCQDVFELETSFLLCHFGYRKHKTDFLAKGNPTQLSLSCQCSTLLASCMLDCELLPVKNPQIFTDASFASNKLSAAGLLCLRPLQLDLAEVTSMTPAQAIQNFKESLSAFVPKNMKTQDRREK